MSKLNIPQIIDDNLYNADKSHFDDTFNLRRIVTVEFAGELYAIHKDNIDKNIE
jgi:hypothetical protein